jgi:hypothetical protein
MLHSYKFHIYHNVFNVLVTYNTCSNFDETYMHIYVFPCYYMFIYFYFFSISIKCDMTRTLNHKFCYFIEFAEFEVQPTIFGYNELKVATRDFHPTMKLGEGSFGVVYKVYFQHT